MKSMKELMGNLLVKVHAVNRAQQRFTVATTEAEAKAAATDLMNSLQEMGEEALVIAAAIRSGGGVEKQN
jgi:hypothetical protein